MQGLINLELIKGYFSRIKDEATWDNSIGHYNIDRYLENVIAKLLNEIYGYELININEEKENYPGIDLRDKVNRIAVQVTADNSIAKINHTIDTFINSKENMKKDYDRLVIFFIKKNKLKYNSTKLDTQGMKFNLDEDVMDFETLYKEIEGYCNDKLCKVLEILKEEFENQKNINLDEIEKIHCVNNFDFYIKRKFMKAEDYGNFSIKNDIQLEDIVKKYGKVVLLSEAGKGKTERTSVGYPR